MMYCDGVMEYESAYLAAFGAVKSFALENDQLSLLDESGAVILVFGKPQAPALEGSSWLVTQVGDTIVPATMVVTMSFENGEISGVAACNNYVAGFSQQEAQLTISEGSVTRMFCEGAGIMEMETAFLNSLAQVRSFEIQMGGLVLLDGSGAVIIYLRP
jgi:heat shock protein HslJ